MSADSPKTPETPSEPAPGGAAEGPSFRGPNVDTGDVPPAAGFLPGVLRFFLVPLVLVAASLAIFAGLGAVVGKGPPTTEDIVRAIAEGGKNARWQAAQELSNQVARGEIDLRKDERLVHTVADAFEKARAGGDDPRVIQHLAVLLGRSGAPAARPALEKALADGNPDVRIFAVAALAEMGDPGTVDALLPRLEDLDPGVRAIAAFAVAGVAGRSGGRGTPEGRAALAKALRDPAVDVRWNAAFGLARLGDPAGADVVWSLLHRDFVRSNLVKGDGAGGGLLSPGGADPASPEEREERVVLNALSAAYRLKDRSMAEGIGALAASDPSDAVRDWAMRASAELDREVREKGPLPQRAWSAAR